MSLIFHVQCDECGAYGYTDKTGPGDLDDAVHCECHAGMTHEQHIARAREGDASARPVTITVGPAGPASISLLH